MFVADLFETTLPQQPKKTQPETMYVEDGASQLVVVLPGRFQPFHLGHLDVFQSLQNKFGRGNVYIATSNKTELPKSPFNFTDKTVFMTATGVPIDRIIEVQSPYLLPKQFDPTKTIFIVAVGAPDRERLAPDSTKKNGQPGYYKTFKSINECVTADKHGYVVIAAERQKVITINGQQVDVSHGTSTRAVWNSIRNDEKARAEFLTQMYGRNDPEVGRILDKIPVTESVSEDSNMPVAVDSTSPIHGGNKPAVEAYGYAYNKRDQRVVWRKTFPSEEAAREWADKKNATILGATPSVSVKEEAAGVGVVSNSKDPRYVMATMGDQNDVRADTLNKEMKAYGLVGRKLPKHKMKEAEELMQKLRSLKEQVGKLKGNK
jgi:hypothetical protein